MSYQGLYINLDRSPERRAAMESECARYGLTNRYHRIAAADGNAANLISPLTNPSEIGCFLSHIRALQEGLKTDQHLHIVEDDTIFSACTAQVIDWSIASGEIDKFDVLYTDIAIPFTNDSYRLFKSTFDQTVTRDITGTITSAAFRTIDLQGTDFLSASSYVINKNAAPKLLELYETEIMQGIRLPIDIFFRNHAKIGSLKIGCLFPFVTSINIEDTLTSTIRNNSDPSKRFTAANIGRYSFFIGCDWEKCQKWIETYITPPRPSDIHAQALAKLMAFSLIDIEPAQKNVSLTAAS